VKKDNLMLHSFIEMISDLEVTSGSIDLNKFSTPGDKSGEPQKDTLDDIFTHGNDKLFQIYRNF
jgi:hypothetical protein